MDTPEKAACGYIESKYYTPTQRSDTYYRVLSIVMTLLKLGTEMCQPAIEKY